MAHWFSVSAVDRKPRDDLDGILWGPIIADIFAVAIVREAFDRLVVSAEMLLVISFNEKCDELVCPRE